MQTQSSILLVSIVDVTCAEAQRQGFTKLGLLGTAVTMDGVFFKRPFERAGMEIATPSDAEKEWIEQKITDELEFGIVKPETVSEFQKIVKRMAEQNGIQAVILGCTELPMLFKDATLSVPVLDTMQIHIAALVEKIMENGGIEL